VEALLAFGVADVGDGADSVGDGVDSVGVVGCGDPVDTGLLPVLLMVPVGVGWRLGEPPLVPPSNRLVPVAGRPRSRSDSGLPAASSTTVTVARMPTNSKTVTATSIRVRPYRATSGGHSHRRRKRVAPGVGLSSVAGSGWGAVGDAADGTDPEAAGRIVCRKVSTRPWVCRMDRV
jgi:hypothetical protein